MTDRLILLYAIGAFLVFTLSQAGMVMRWKRQGNAYGRMIVNAVGAAATGATTLVVLVGWWCSIGGKGCCTTGVPSC